MSVDIKGRKRKSGDDVAIVTSKKVRTAKPTEAPAPLKSALKKTKAQPKEVKASTPKKEVKITKKATRSTNAKSNGGAVKQKEPAPLPVADEDNDEGGVDLSVDQTAALIAGFSSDESDAEDDANGRANEGLDISTLPAAPTTAALQKSKSIAEADDPDNVPGVIYLGRIPHGFYEKQMRAYFTQFGAITNLRLARNKRTGNSKHYAFIEFASSAVADIVAKTMDKYLLFGHILQAKRVPREQVKENIWIQGKTPDRPVPRNKMERGVLRRGMVREGWEKRVQKEEERRLAKAEKLKELGYEFDMPAVIAVSDVPIKPKAIEQAEKKDQTGADRNGQQALDEGNGVEVVQQETTVQAEPGKVTVVEKKEIKKRKPSSSDAPSKSKKKKVGRV